MHAACWLNAFRNSIPTWAKSQKNSSEIPKLLRLACRCDVRIAELQTRNSVPHASRSLPIEANSFSGRLDERRAACRLRL